MKIKIDKEKFLKIIECDFCPKDLGFEISKKSNYYCDYDCYSCWEVALKKAEVKDFESEN